MWKKLGVTVLLVSGIVLVVSFVGREMIQASPVNELAQLQVQKQYGVRASDLSVKLFKTYKFSEGENDGSAEFSTCDQQGICYEIKAQKKNGDWQLVHVAKK